MSRRRLILPALLGLLLAGCGYFNSLYNAQRRFAAAERAARDGDMAAARSGYTAAVEKAAAGYRRYPEGRWADDALFLIGRARFAMGEPAAARAALARVVARTPDADMRAGARAYLGAALLRLGSPDSAIAVLDSAFTGTKEGSELRRFVRLWRGRALLDLGREDGWTDLAAVTDATHALATDAGLEIAARALDAGDSVRATGALARLSTLEASASRADSIMRLLERAGTTWSPAFVGAELPEQAGARWPADARTRVGLVRARLAMLAGDTVGAIREGRGAAELSSTGASADARAAVAQWLLSRLSAPEQLAEVRAVLLPAYAYPRPLALARQIRTMEELLARARGGQAIALFAAAEYARDVLGAPRLARELFVAHADFAPAAVTAPKALLAALVLTGTEAERSALRGRVAGYPNNPYVRSLDGAADADAYAAAEERLGRAVGALRADAEASAMSRDVTVSQAITALDSLRLLARTDSLRISCGALLDSLGVRGIRADSVRSACLRADTVLVGRFLVIDSVLLRDTLALDSTRARVPAADTTLE